MKILALDFGLKNIGLATNQDKLVEPLKPIKIKNLKQALDKINLICEQNRFEKIAIGLPEGKLKTTVLGFGRQLETKTNLKVALVPEDFTSFQAREKMIETDKPLKKRKTEEHSIAAGLILEEYLDTMKSEGGENA